MVQLQCIIFFFSSIHPFFQCLTPSCDSPTVGLAMTESTPDKDYYCKGFYFTKLNNPITQSLTQEQHSTPCTASRHPHFQAIPSLWGQSSPGQAVLWAPPSPFWLIRRGWMELLWMPVQFATLHPTLFNTHYGRLQLNTSTHLLTTHHTILTTWLENLFLWDSGLLGQAPWGTLITPPLQGKAPTSSMYSTLKGRLYTQQWSIVLWKQMYQ